MRIRALRREDYDGADGLMRQVHRLHADGRPDLFLPMEHPYSKEEFEHLASDEAAVALAAEENGALLGLCIVTLRDKSNMVPMRVAYLEDLVVDRAYRRRGIAKALFAQAEKRAAARGAGRMDLMVWAFNEDARKFYEAVGMRPQRYIYEKPL